MAQTVDPELIVGLRKELQFVQNLFNTAKSVNQYVTAANAAARVAGRAVSLLPPAPPAAAPVVAPVAVKAAHSGEEMITITGLPVGRDWNWNRLKKYLNEMGLMPRHIDKAPVQDWGVAAFKDSADVDAALQALNKRDGITATRGRDPALYEGRNRKRGGEGADDDVPGKVARKENVCDSVCQWWRRPYADQLRDKAQKVAAALKKVTTSLDLRMSEPKPAWLSAATAGSKGGRGLRPAVPLDGILRSPLIDFYRNKVEFTMGFDADNAPRAGFLLGSYADGVTHVCDPEPARHTSRVAIGYAQLATDYMRLHSKLPPYDKRKKADHGFWRLLLVREGRHSTYLPGSTSGATFDDFDPYHYLSILDTPAAASSAPAAAAATAAGVAAPEAASTSAGAAPSPPAHGAPLSQYEEPAAGLALPLPDEVLLMIQVTDQYRGGAGLDEEVAGMAAFFREAAATHGLPLTSVCVMVHNGISNAAAYDAPIRVLIAAPTPVAAASAAGDAALRESAAPAGAIVAQGGFFHDALLDLKFRISATAFFQVNSAATCVLYKLVGEWAATRPSTLLLDVCCGTGTIGLTLARKVTHVIGIDSVAESIKDAAANAALNGITNCEFVCAKAEDALGTILAQQASKYDDVVAILDPPRCGCHKTAIAALLRCPALRRIVYVSCNPNSLSENMEQLCGPCPTSGGNRGFVAQYVPFHPVRAVALDLFPHTPHVESVVLMERS